MLDVGCGSGAFLRVAADHGATVCGLDASARAARDRPRARARGRPARQGDLQHLPYVDDCFDVVCGFNSFFFADDMVAALREAGRVAKPGAPVVIQVWGRPERFDLGLMKDVLARFTPPRRPGGIDPTTLWRPACSSDSRRRRASRPTSRSTSSWAYEFADEAELARAMTSAGGFGAIVGADRQAAARTRSSRRSRSAGRPTAATGWRTSGTS